MLALSPFAIQQLIDFHVCNVGVANVVINVENVLDYNGLHPIFTYIPSKVQMFFTLWKPYVMFLFNSLAMLLQLCLLWQCHLSSIYSLNRLSYGNVICGTIVVCLTTCTTIGTPLTTIGTANGSTLPFIIFYAFKYMLSCSLFIPETKAPPSSTLFFLLRALFEEFDATFFYVLQCCLHFLPSSFNLGQFFCGLSF